MTDANQIINGLWIGNKLSPLELLTIKSFLSHGHQFQLWVYQKLENQLPAGLILRDANEIIPERDVFAKLEADPEFKIGKGSFAAPFSDLFRYRLLYLHGGWWVDMDVTCLKPFDFEEPYFFRSHDRLKAIGTVMKCPKGSELMKIVYDQVKSECDENTSLYLMPNMILNVCIKAFALEPFIKAEFCNPDNWMDVFSLFSTRKAMNEDYYAFHWMNENWRSGGVHKNTIRRGSFLGKLIEKYELEGEVSFTTSYLPFFKHWVNLWYLKGRNWMRSPGIPVFVKKWLGDTKGVNE
ncbi:MAG: glycosyltransferase [Bacteroidota bacterium]